jgi:hypothetical protein
LASNGVGAVTLSATQQALRWSAYLESHARRAYASMGLDNAEAARAIWRRICKGDLADGFSARDIQRKGWAGLGAKGRIAAGLEALVEVDWLASHEKSAGAQGGRPTAQYSANPKALARFSTR